MIFKVKKDFNYSRTIGSVTEFHEGELYEFEPYIEPHLPEIKQNNGDMICKTKLYPDSNNGYIWDKEYFDQHFTEVKQDDIILYDNNHNMLFGHTVNKIDKFGNCGQEYHQNVSAIEIYNDAIKNALESIDYAHKMDMNYMLSQYNLAVSNKKIYKELVKNLIEDYSEANIEKAKFILKNVH